MTGHRSGLLLAAAGIALMCAMDAVAKALGAHLTTFQIVFVRFFGAAIWLALWIAMTRGAWPRLSDIGRQALRGVMLVATASMFFYALSRLPLALVAALGMTAPLYVTLIGAIGFREKLDARAWLALVLGAAGAGIIILGGGGGDGSDGGSDALAWMAALLAPFTYAVTLAIMKHHATREEPAAMTLGQSLIAAILVLPLALGAVPAVVPDVMGLVALIGLLGASGYMLLINGLRLIPVSSFAVIDYTALLWAAAFGLVFFAELPGLPFWIGAMLIVGACVINAGRAPMTATEGAAG